MVKGYDLFVPINYGLHHTCDKWVLLYERVSQHWTLDDFWTALMQQVSKHGDLTSMFMDPRKLLNHCRQCYINM